jgi:hypothetical protein
MCGCLCKGIKESWATVAIATFVECLNDKDKSMWWIARKLVDEVNEEGVLH